MNSTEVAYIISSTIVRECHISVTAEKTVSRRAILHRVVGCTFVRNRGYFPRTRRSIQARSSQIRLEYSTSVSRNFTAESEWSFSFF